MINDLLRHGCDVLLSGHTHVPQCDEIDGFYLINPGSTTLPRRGVRSLIVLFLLTKGKSGLNLKK